MKTDLGGRDLRAGGYTLVELIIASAVTLLVVSAAFGTYIMIFRSWRGIELRMEADRKVNNAMGHLVYGVGDRRGLRSAAGLAMVDDVDGVGWSLTYWNAAVPPQTNVFTYSAANSNLVFDPGSVVVGEGIALALVELQGQSLSVTLRVDRVRGALRASRQIGTEIAWRN